MKAPLERTMSDSWEESARTRGRIPMSGGGREARKGKRENEIRAYGFAREHERRRR